MKRLLPVLLLSVILTASLLPITAGAAPTSDISVTVDGRAVVFPDMQPFVDPNGRTLVPIAPLAPVLGLNVSWDAASRQATFSKFIDTAEGPYQMSLIFTIGDAYCQTVALKDGNPVSSVPGRDIRPFRMDTAAVIASGRTCVPVKYLAEFFGYSVAWDGNTLTVKITSSNSATGTPATPIDTAPDPEQTTNPPMTNEDEDPVPTNPTQTPPTQADNTANETASPQTPDSPYLTDLCPAYENSASWAYKEYSALKSGYKESFKMGGVEYLDGLTLRHGNWAVYNLNGKYTSLTGVLCHVDGTETGYPNEMRPPKLHVLLDGVLEAEYELSSDMAPKDITINVSGAKQLKLETVNVGFSEGYGIGNPVLE